MEFHFFFVLFVFGFLVFWFCLWGKGWASGGKTKIGGRNKKIGGSRKKYDFGIIFENHNIQIIYFCSIVTHNSIFCFFFWFWCFGKRVTFLSLFFLSI